MTKSRLHGGRVGRNLFAALCATSLLSACAEGTISHKGVEGQFPVVQGPVVTDNSTPFSTALQCIADQIKLTGQRPVAVTVGAVRDHTGKFTESDGGNAITQGGSLMTISALGKMGDAIVLRERFDTQVADIELKHLEARRLGDGQRHQVTDETGSKTVPWIPYPGGSILKSEVYIVGGITELNYNIFSGGAGVEISGIGGGARTFVANVAVDLRVVNSSNLNVIKVVSLQKQVVGYEVRAGVFNFFGSNLFDIESGLKSQEPLQLAVRSVIELGVIQMMSHLYGVDHTDCTAALAEEDVIASAPPRFYRS